MAEPARKGQMSQEELMEMLLRDYEGYPDDEGRELYMDALLAEVRRQIEGMGKGRRSGRFPKREGLPSVHQAACAATALRLRAPRCTCTDSRGARPPPRAR